MIVLGLTGLAASGKNRVAEYLETKYKASRYSFSSPLRAAMRCLQIEENRPNLADISRILRQRFGEDLLAKALAESVKKDKSELIVVDGVRREADLYYLKQISGFHLVSVNADIKIRHERLIKRGQNSDDNKTFEEFVADHDRETEKSIPPLMAIAEFQIDNNGNEEELEKQIDKIIQKISEKK